uniref:Uncharacterized protein n=1 Tax=Rhizophora mucronata TaxID=61149 RepID=A0A2P2MAW2_RHIMU
MGISRNHAHMRYCRRLSPLMDSISLRISCVRDLTGSSTSSSNSPRNGIVSGRSTRYSSFRLFRRYFAIRNPKIRDRTFSLRVCNNTSWFSGFHRRSDPAVTAI